MNRRLSDLIEKARDQRMTDEEWRKQAISFVYGNVHFEDGRVTREAVTAAYDRIHAGGAGATGGAAGGTGRGTGEDGR
jgi:hypothetical protein